MANNFQVKFLKGLIEVFVSLVQAEEKEKRHAEALQTLQAAAFE